ncbi:YihY/virulence factor BrkB family protein [Devosia rhodophyticola]|uniref:YihY/virulence factor BrkB family protein n=1 Tax=Devosia rhodophyticola TaxID=3026423 RepID=A0ABY7YXR5_9HYPH|nr:YihY/virulence factor BrkB family protein [Devosia rhodophyticola]WDR05878.1 YihY/virulence factor BrkB family protein [Devosia rhodophyticola]
MPSDAELAAQEDRGRQANRPGAIPLKGWKDIGWRIFRSIGQDRILLTSAGVTFYLLFALVPTLTAFVSVYGLFNERSTVIDQVSLLVGIVPTSGINIITDQLTRLAGESDGALGFALVISLSVAFWSSSAGIKALFQAMNVAYLETEKRSFIVLNLIALSFTVLGAIAGLLIVAVVLVMPTVLNFLPGRSGLEWLVRITGYLAMLMVLVVGIASLYRWGPSREDAKWRWLTPGAGFALIALSATSIGYSWYVSNVGDYNAAYGSLGALIGFLTWIWISVTIVILGAEFNSELEHQTAQDTTTGPDEPLGERGAYMADTIGQVWPPARGDK